MVGFTMDEIMVGTHRFVGQEDDHPMHFNITWGNKNLLVYLNPFSREFLYAEAKGIITVGGLVNKADCMGSLKLLYFTERKIRYVLEFSNEQGRRYRYVGEKVNIWPWNLHTSHVTCYGTITELATGKVVSKSIVYFPLRELLTFIRSSRLVYSDNRIAGETSPLGREESVGEQKRSYKVLSAKEARIIAAMAGGIIPRGGESFELGAADLEEKWLPRTDHMLSRMPAMTRLELKCIMHVFNYALPILYNKKRFMPLTAMDERERTKLFHIVEKSRFLGPVSILLVKILVFPAFYGLSEVKDAIGYREKFLNSPQFEGIKD
jgi:hypothetical protein